MNEEQVNRIILNGFPYEIDRKNEVLLPREVPRPAISFSAMKKSGNAYQMFINPSGDVVPNEERYLPAKICIPVELLDTPLSMNDVARGAFNRNSYRQDWGVLVYDRPISERLDGKLPEIDIYGDRFIVDWQLKELRMVHDPEKSLNIKSFVLSEDGEVYQGYYNTVLRKPADITIGITEMPRNVVLLEIPNELKLDPISVAREHGLQSTELLRYFPIVDNLKAGVVTLAKTPVSEMVRNNRNRAALSESTTIRQKL